MFQNRRIEGIRGSACREHIWEGVSQSVGDMRMQGGECNKRLAALDSAEIRQTQSGLGDWQEPQVTHRAKVGAVTKAQGSCAGFAVAPGAMGATLENQDVP